VLMLQIQLVLHSEEVQAIVGGEPRCTIARLGARQWLHGDLTRRSLLGFAGSCTAA